MISNTESIDGPTATPVSRVRAPFMMTPSFVAFFFGECFNDVSIFASVNGCSIGSNRAANSGSHWKSGNFVKFFATAAGSKS